MQNIRICKTVIFSVVFVGVEMFFMLREEMNYRSLKIKCLGR
jgi:HKD family nuclease